LVLVTAKTSKMQIITSRLEQGHTDRRFAVPWDRGASPTSTGRIVGNGVLSGSRDRRTELFEPMPVTGRLTARRSWFQSARYRAAPATRAAIVP